MPWHNEILLLTDSDDDGDGDHHHHHHQTSCNQGCRRRPSLNCCARFFIFLYVAQGSTPLFLNFLGPDALNASWIYLSI